MMSFIKRLASVGVALILVAQCLSSRELIDELGRHVDAPQDPRRIICLAPSITETVFALGRGEDVIGVTDYTEYPPEAHRKTSVGGLIDPSIEKIVSLHPDLVLATREINRRETVEELERLGISVFVINPQGLKGILASILDIGKALNCSREAEALARQLEEKGRRVAARVAELPRPKVFVLIWHDPVVTAGSKAFITEVISAAGGESATADIPQAWPRISLEEVLHRSPDFLLLVRGSHQGITLDELKQRAGWNRLKAVRENRVIHVDERLQHSSPLVFDALEDLARKLHPEAFESR
jgi:ABC-type Fe3+-hydroxamate transport system substrate-binding protein